MAAFENVEEQELIPEVPRFRVERRARAGRANSDQFWNVMTMLVWLGIAAMVMMFVSIYNNPASRWNILRPPQATLVAGIVLPTNAPDAAMETAAPALAPTHTETPTPPPTETPTPEPTATVTLTPGPSATPTIDSLYPFILRNEAVAIAGDAMADHDTCKLWVAGQTYDLQGAPMVGVTVMLGGSLGGRTLYQLSLTGTALQFGQAGYEFTVAEQPVESEGTAWVQLFDQALIPLSGRVPMNTFADCKQNLILINFRQVR